MSTLHVVKTYDDLLAEIADLRAKLEALQKEHTKLNVQASDRIGQLLTDIARLEKALAEAEAVIVFMTPETEGGKTDSRILNPYALDSEDVHSQLRRVRDQALERHAARTKGSTTP